MISILAFTGIYILSIRIVRRRIYEFFLVAHIILAALFLVGVIMHWRAVDVWIYVSYSVAIANLSLESHYGQWIDYSALFDYYYPNPNLHSPSPSSLHPRSNCPFPPHRAGEQVNTFTSLSRACLDYHGSCTLSPLPPLQASWRLSCV